ncbi:MAG TPA: polymer-forming cytoskeletal protein [Steroidobacteraceae bacterium]
MPPSNKPTESVSVLGPSLRFKGELHADEDLQILGQVEGSISHSKYLTIAPEGRVKANISGHIIVVEGTVEGDLVAEVSVAVTASGHLAGDIRSPSISINDGADVNGKVIMDAAKPARPAGSAEHRAATNSGAADAAAPAKGA